MLCAIPLKPSGSRSPKPRDASEQIASRCAGDEQDDAYTLRPGLRCRRAALEPARRGFGAIFGSACRAPASTARVRSDSGSNIGVPTKLIQSVPHQTR